MNARSWIRWCRVNLFGTPFDAALSLIFIPLSMVLAWKLGMWALAQAQWSVVTENLRVLMIGTMPRDFVPRTWGSGALLALLTGATLGIVSHQRFVGVGAAAASVGAAALLLASEVGTGLALACVAAALLGWFATARWTALRKFVLPGWGIALLLIALLLAPAGTQHWGGLLMSVLVTLLASVLSIPLGVLLALGRRSRFSSARILCTGYIEVMRSLPLILIVYWVWIVVPLLARNTAIPDLLRGLAAFALFFAAYVAEYVRSGLQSVPRGQFEAAQSLGMSSGQLNRDVVLPQALRVVTPALVGNVLDVFNTVPLLFIIGLTDFLRAGQMVLVNPQSAGRTYEMYVFMFIVYLAIASLITYGARRLEARMAVGHH
jgi:general L-amino acid transport system permease protein